MKRRAFAFVVAALAVRTLLPIGASAAVTSVEPLSVRVREADLGADGSARLVVSVAGAQAMPSFTVTEQGAPVEGVDAQPLSAASQPIAVALAIDVSGSTAGRPLLDAKRAASAFVAALSPNVRVELIAFGAHAAVVVPFTTDRNSVQHAIGALQAKGETALYDAIALAARNAGRAQAQPNVVVFTDGRDTVSKATLASAVKIARDAHAPVTMIGLKTKDLDAASLTAVATQTGGRTISVGSSAGLAAAFADAAHDLASQYVLSYATDRAPKEVTIAVTATDAGRSASDHIAALGSKAVPSSDAPAPTLVKPGAPMFPFFQTETGLIVGIGGAFAGALLLFGVLFWRPQRSEFATVMQRSLKVYTRGSGKKKKKDRSGAKDGVRFWTGIVERMPRHARTEEKLQRKIDRAGWPIRASELMAIQAGGAVAGVLLGWGLFGRWWLGLVLAVVGPLLPKMFLSQRISSRSVAFLGQLPDTLQLLAGSLQAGYGFMQAIDTLVKESPAPTSAEFGRVLTETRLGMPVDDALNAMADRLESEDFRWVVLAINIQRQVGGNLAVLLRTVADTLRERDRVRRQVKVLSAEGKLSAYILGALPFGIAGYIAMVNPTFIGTLTGDPLGRAMIGGSLVMLGLGIAWMRKIIRIEV